MNLGSDELRGLSATRLRTFSSTSKQSSESSKHIAHILNNDSGLYTCSSNTSDCSLQLDSDIDSSHQSTKTRRQNDERLRLALQDVHKLRSELERLAKSEQWYKLELKQQKSKRLEDLERIYSQERKFMQENQRLQKECVRLYEKCNELERELQKQNQEIPEYQIQRKDDKDNNEENTAEYEKEQHLSLINSQQHLISVLRKQKRSLLDDLRSLTEEKHEKVVELQRLLADLEFDNKHITRKCTQFAKERLSLENDLRQRDNKLSEVLEEKMNLEKSIVDLKGQLESQQKLLKLREIEVENIQQHYTDKIQHEQDLDEVHKLSLMYQETINAKTLEIINLKERLQEMQGEMEDMQNIQQQNELQQRQIDQLNFVVKAYHLELKELKSLQIHKNKQLEELHTAIGHLTKDKELVYKTTMEQQNDLLRVKQALKSTQEQYEQLQQVYKKTQLQLELLEIEQKKLKFQNDRDQREIEELRNKLKEYLEQSKVLSKRTQYLENKLNNLLKENVKLQQDSEQMKKYVKVLEGSCNVEKEQIKLIEKLSQNGAIIDPKKIDFSNEVLKSQQNLFIHQELNENAVDQDFPDLLQQCEKLQAQIDFIKDNHVNFENHQVLDTLNNFSKNFTLVKEGEQNSLDSSRAESFEKETDFINVSLQCDKLQKNVDKLHDSLCEKQHMLSRINRLQDSNKGIEKLVTENEFLKQKLYETKTEALVLQTKQDINERAEKYTQMKAHLENHIKKVVRLQKDLLENDGKLYKLEKKLQILQEVDKSLEDIKFENRKLKEQLMQEQVTKTELSEELAEESEKLKNLRQSLEELKMNQKSKKNQAIQCSLTENLNIENSEVKNLKEKVSQLQEQQRYFLEIETHKKEERLKFFNRMMDVQNNKIKELQQHEKDWEDVLTSLNNANSLEKQTRKELELKRMELEELNQVFAEQNEEFRKLEEFTALLELKRQQEKQQQKLTFQQEINVMKEHLHDCKEEIERLKKINQQLEKINEKLENDINEDCATKTSGYENEIEELKSKVVKLIEEKDNLVENLKELEKQNKNFKNNKREAILMPDLSLVAVDTLANNSLENMAVLKQNISEDHLRILTKVLKAEYERKMLRYDEHIHSLLNNLKSLKKSLKANEEKTTLLIEEQLKTKDELKVLQKTKDSLEKMRLKYEQSQTTIKELKDSLDSERKKFELSDLGKSQNSGTSYEVSNLIDDYKKLIQQSAEITKRPSTSAILDLIQRSNQYVPNLDKLQNNFQGLRSEIQTILTSYTHRIPATSYITTASLSVPPSLMDELRVASEGF